MPNLRYDRAGIIVTPDWGTNTSADDLSLCFNRKLYLAKEAARSERHTHATVSPPIVKISHEVHPMGLDFPCAPRSVRLPEISLFSSGIHLNCKKGSIGRVVNEHYN